MNLIYETIAWLLIIQVFVTAHFWVIERQNKTPKHLISWLCSVVLAIGISTVYHEQLLMRIISVVYLGLLYWIVFPLQLNLFRKKPLLYIGNGTLKWENNNRFGKVIWLSHASWLDSLERRIGNPVLTLEIKSILLALILACLILL